MHWWLICARGLWAPAMVATSGVILSSAISRLASTFPAHSGLRTAALLLSLGTVLATTVMVAVFVLRLRAWEIGRGPDCRACSGPLGRLRDGRVMYGKQLPDFRRCYNCGSRTPEA